MEAAEVVPVIKSVNVGQATPTEYSSLPTTGIDKRPVTGPVAVTAPGHGGSGLSGDTICDTANHGGPDQAVYAYAWEDLQAWAQELGRELSPGVFGENLTTENVDVTGAVVGELWRVGSTLLEVCVPRIPCRTFAGWLGEQGWVKTFTERAIPGAYLRVLEPGEVRAGDTVDILERPDHGVDMGTVFRALTTEPDLLPRLVGLDRLSAEAREKVRRRTA